MIVVTGGAGFIGSNIVKELNRRGRRDILVVDDLTDGHKFERLVGCDLADYVDKDVFIRDIELNAFTETIDVLFHQGACTDTTNWDGKYMMDINFTYSKKLLNYCIRNKVQFIYASSAAVYGMNKSFAEESWNERPSNVYGYSKYLFDQYVRRVCVDGFQDVVGLRYFNVYGPGEGHKNKMASIAYQHYQQLNESGSVKLFSGCGAYDNGEQTRDFVYIDDVVAVNMWVMDNHVSGIFNVGTGMGQTFNEVANSVISYFNRGHIEYVPFPSSLVGCYQSFTEADVSKLRAVGYKRAFLTVQEGVTKYMKWLVARQA